MAVNKQLSELSFADAELTVSAGESDVIDNYNGAPIFDWSAVTTDGYYYNDEDTPDNQKIQKFMPTGIQFADGGYTTWDSGQGYQSVGTGQYTIEYLGPYTTEGSSAVMGAGVVSNRRYLYRVTGLSVSSKGGVRIIQTILATTD